jgi:hypothetical protein
MPSKLSPFDWKTILVGLFCLAIFIGIRFYLTGRIEDWILSIFDLMIGIFGGGLLLFILSEIFGRKIIGRIAR